MGTDFTAVVNHNFDDRDIHNLPDLLNRTWSRVQPLLPIIEGYPVPGSSPLRWQWSEREGGFSLERLHSCGTAMIEGNEFSGFVSDHVFRICHGVRWSSFLTDQTTRRKTRQVCRHIAAVLGSNQIVYVPDGFLKPEGVLSLMYEGKVVEDMIDWLLKNCGSAAQDIDSILSEEPGTWNENRYYIERI
jgi:hypothetical protein